jgi:hypothetical protein
MTFLSFFAERILDDQAQRARQRPETHSDLGRQLAHDATQAAAEPIFRPRISHSAREIFQPSAKLADPVTRLSCDTSGNSSNVAIEIMALDFPAIVMIYHRMSSGLVAVMGDGHGHR